MSFKFQIPDLSNGTVDVDLSPGSSTFIVGANGGGKTRLAVYAEQHWGDRAHRISAHRSLNLNLNVSKISEERAIAKLRSGFEVAPRDQWENFRIGHRWQSNAETVLLNDFDSVLQALFADQANIALQTHFSAHNRTLDEPKFTRFQKLVSIWESVLPHRALQITGDDIKVVAEGQPPYSAEKMSDGERAIFYMVGQILLAETNSILIFDEPELHVHRAILGRLWDEIEVARPDCAFFVITHDLDFAASRPGQKLVIRRFQPPGRWEVERVPEESGFTDEIATLILGSRRPILFVEGTGSSLDLAIYRACYPDWTVLPRGSCQDVIHSVVTMRYNASLTRVTCSGIVDADDYSDEEKATLSDLGVATLPVSEIENLFLLPEIATAILKAEGFMGADLDGKLEALKDEILAEVSRPHAINEVLMRYCRRRIDRTLKKIDLSNATTPADLAENYVRRTADLNVSAVAAEFRRRIDAAVTQRDISMLLANFDNKALLALAAKHLKGTTKGAFESWLTRAMRAPQASELKAALGGVLPAITAR